MDKPGKVEVYALLNFALLFLIFLALRAYLVLSGNVGGNFPPSEITAGFLEDLLAASLLSLAAFLSLRLGKLLFFCGVLPLQLFVVITGYSNLQYVQFFRENLRLFDLEYMRNMGGLWLSTATDMKFREGEILFLIVPLLLVLFYAYRVARRLKTRHVPPARTALAAAAFLGLAAAAFVTAAALKDKTRDRAFHQNNFFVRMVGDIPRTVSLVRETHAMIRSKPAVQRRDTGLKNFRLEEPKSGSSSGMPPPVRERPFPLPDGYIWLDDDYPFIKIPERDAALLSPAALPESGGGRDTGGPEPFQPRNIVFLMLESFRCEEIDLFGGRYGITPQFNALASRGTLFRNFFGHSDMTGRAVFNALGSFYDTFKGLSITREYSDHSLFTLPEILNLFGYSSAFIHSWPAEFDNLDIFFRRHGRLRIVDKSHFAPDAETAGWAPSDEELMRMAVRTMDQAPKPFFAVVLSATNHVPYEKPASRPGLGLESGMYAKYLDTFAYTDYALGFFFKLIATRKYFRDTVFFIFADHGDIRQRSDIKHQPPERFRGIHHLPLIIYDPAHEEGRVVDDPAGQIDLAPTVLDILKIRIANHFIGQSLLGPRKPVSYLAYHGRDFPQCYYVDDSLFCTVNTDKDRIRAFRPDDGRKIDLTEDQHARVMSQIRNMVELTDWAIFSDRIWDPRLDAFYRALYGKSGR